MTDASEVLRIKAEVDRLKQQLAGVDGELKQLTESSADRPEDLPKLRDEYAKLSAERNRLFAEFWKEHAKRLGREEPA